MFIDQMKDFATQNAFRLDLAAELVTPEGDVNILDPVSKRI
jgi:hypothetical protein